MKTLLDILLPRFFPDLLFLCVPHDGKNDLERSIPRKLRGWREPGVRFVVFRDNDRGDCKALKEHLRELCSIREEGHCLIRIACQELEAWYLGEPDALAEAFGREWLREIGARARFRLPDAVAYPSKALAKLVPEYQKISGARLLANHLTRERNCSPSFQAMMNGVERLASALLRERVNRPRPGRQSRGADRGGGGGTPDRPHRLQGRGDDGDRGGDPGRCAGACRANRDRERADPGLQESGIRGGIARIRCGRLGSHLKLPGARTVRSRARRIAVLSGRSFPRSVRSCSGGSRISLIRHVGIVYEGSQADLVFERLSLDELLKR